MSDFEQLFLESTGRGLSLAEKIEYEMAPDIISVGELASLFAHSHYDLVKNILVKLCMTRELEAELHKFGRSVVWLVHRDNARRFFQYYGMFPDKGTPLHKWLTGWDNRKGRPPTFRQRERHDFRQLCRKLWRDQSALPVKGPYGVVTMLRGGYFGRYAETTLEKWAREAREGPGKPGPPPRDISSELDESDSD